MPKTNLQDKIDYLKRVIEEGKKTKTYPKYNTICKKLEELVDFSDTLYGENKKMTPEDFERLNTLYSDVKQECTEYIEQDKTTNYEKAQERIIKDIARVLEKDIAELAKCDTTKPASFSEIIENARRYTISISAKDYQTVGAALSSRIPLKTPSGKKGFFTPVSTFNSGEKVDAAVDKHINAIAAKYPAAKEYLEKIKTDKELKEKLLDICPESSIEELRNNDLHNMADKALRDVARHIGIGAGKSDSEIKDMLYKDEELEKVVSNFIRDIAAVVNMKGVMKDAGITEGSNISGRNCAMTDMAKLLGCENLLANSAHMTIMIDGEPVTGVFTETVEGSDINRLKEDDPILKGDADMCLNSDLMLQAADLQVLDFICGNIDRHMGNMIYNVKDENGRISVKGIKGIDNDCAFGTPDLSDGNNVMSLVNIKGMKYIRQSMLNRLQSIQNKAVLKYRLSGNGLRDDEIDAAWDRLVMVREAAVNWEITPVKDDFWTEKNISTLPFVRGGNYFNRIKAIGETAQSSFEDITEVKDIKYVVDNTSKKAIFKKAKEIEKIRQHLDKVNTALFNSSEYSIMEKSFKEIEKYSEDVKKLNKPEDMTDEMAAKIAQAYTELADKTSRYVKLKKLIPATTRGKNRIDFALGMLDFASTAVREISPGLEKMDETKRDAASPEVIEEANRIMSNDVEIPVSDTQQNTHPGKKVEIYENDDVVFEVE